MATINFYLDKPDRKGLAPIHLRINCNGSQIKLATGQKIHPADFDKRKQEVVMGRAGATEVNHYLGYLKVRAAELLKSSNRRTFSETEVKETIAQYIEGYKENSAISIVREQGSSLGRAYTFVDLFAGAGGFSEGFLQAELNDRFFDFVAASDINENCELTHVVRYNYQLGLDAEFLRQDITEPDFLENLRQKIGPRDIDVVCGGPPCQSFSLAGKRKKYDKKDNLFSHYLEVIKVLQPKYFIMENVKGILTKDSGKIKDLIIQEINSIVDLAEIPVLVSFINGVKSVPDRFLFECIGKRVELEMLRGKDVLEGRASYIRLVDSKFKRLTPKIVDYRTSKMDFRINTIRHGFNILERSTEWEKLKRDIIREKDFCNIDGDAFAADVHSFLSQISIENIIAKIEDAFHELQVPSDYAGEVADILQALKVYTGSFDEVVETLKDLMPESERSGLDDVLSCIRLYKIEKPFVANASNYGVPQNRERVLFIGCRKDQKIISDIPPTVRPHEKVTVYEALHDLDFIGINQEAHQYQSVEVSKRSNAASEQWQCLLKPRTIDGKVSKESGKTFADWSRDGRLIKRYNAHSKPIYVKSFDGLRRGEKYYDILNNHKTSNQNENVVQRLKIILKNGDYKKSKCELESCGLGSNKRNYNVLKPDEQSSTIMTIPDDYIHYNSPRALTVREMARLQSFDDSFVFQGKRSTGGNNRKTEVPQYTLVGNAVPPLLARAVAMEILRKIK